MNELKLRAWDVFNAVYYYSKEYPNLAEFFEACQACIDGGNHLVFEQYLILDCNNNEVYEGDISDMGELKGIIRLSQITGSYIEWINYTGFGSTPLHTFIGNSISFDDDTDDNYGKFLHLVCGNIHQDKELLGDIPQLVGKG